MLLRRTLVASLATLPLIASARPRKMPAECAWMVGKWQSDVAQTMANFTFDGQRPTAEMQARIKQMFGNLSHTITPTQFTVDETFNGQTSRHTWDYEVDSFSASSVSLVFPATAIPGMTLFRKNDSYFVRTGSNFEYFKKSPA